MHFHPPIPLVCETFSIPLVCEAFSIPLVCEAFRVVDVLSVFTHMTSGHIGLLKQKIICA